MQVFYFKGDLGCAVVVPPRQRGRRLFCVIKGVRTCVASAQYVHFRQNWTVTSPFKQGRELVPLPRGSGEDPRSALLTRLFQKVLGTSPAVCVRDRDREMERQKTDTERDREKWRDREGWGEREKEREEEEDVWMG